MTGPFFRLSVSFRAVVLLFAAVLISLPVELGSETLKMAGHYYPTADYGYLRLKENITFKPSSSSSDYRVKLGFLVENGSSYGCADAAYIPGITAQNGNLYLESEHGSIYFKPAYDTSPSAINWLDDAMVMLSTSTSLTGFCNLARKNPLGGDTDTCPATGTWVKIAKFANPQGEPFAGGATGPHYLLCCRATYVNPGSAAFVEP
jgi:hypothetical protein